MRLKTIEINGRHMSAIDNVIQRIVNHNSPIAELPFAVMDKAIEALEAKKVGEVEGVFTRSTRYDGVVSELNPERGLVLAFGCWEVGTLDEVKGFYEKLKEINKDPYMAPNPNVFHIERYFVTIRSGEIWTCNEDGDTCYDRVSTVDDMKVVLAAMEKPLPVIRYTGRPAEIQYRHPTENTAYLKVSCVTLDLETVRKAVEFLAEVQKKQQVTGTTPEIKQ